MLVVIETDIVTCHREIVVKNNSSLCFRHPLSVSTVTMSQRDCCKEQQFPVFQTSLSVSTVTISQRDCCKEQQFPVFQTSSVSVHCKHVTERLL